MSFENHSLSKFNHCSMAMELIEPQNQLKSHKFDNFIGKNYELAVNQSIESLLESLNKPSSNLSVFTPKFLELMQVKPDPPLETIWVFSSLAFHSHSYPKDEPLDQLLAVTDLFQSITACSASCSSSKSIALIAPVIYELYRVVVDLKGKDLGLKRERKVRKQIKSFIDVILGHLNLCSSEGTTDDEELGLIRPLNDLVSVWLEDNVVGNGGGNEVLRMFFPLSGNWVVERLSKGGCDVNELAGVVIAEAFLLRLCLNFVEGRSRVELQNELRTWAVGSITGFHNFHFFATLVKMLLEPSLPVTSLLNPEDEMFLRKMLYDSLISVDYAFLRSNEVAHQRTGIVKNILMARLIVTHEAIELFRGNGDHTKSISYINAFSGSYLPLQLLKCVTSKIGMVGEANGPKGSSPKAYLKWLLEEEDKGARLFDDIMLKNRARLLIDNLKADSGKADDETSEDDVLFFIDNKGKVDDGVEDDGKVNESMSAVFMAAAHTMQSAKEGGGRKRKEGRGAGKKKQVKFQRYDLFGHLDSSGDKDKFLDKDGSRSGSEVEDPLSDDEMEEKEQ